MDFTYENKNEEDRKITLTLDREEAKQLMDQLKEFLDMDVEEYNKNIKEMDDIYEEEKS